jgi:PilZ domain
MKPKHFEREVRRARFLSAWVKVEGRALCECRVLDISMNGAKVAVEITPEVPDRFELAFVGGNKSRVCEVVWRRARMLGIKFVW